MRVGGVCQGESPFVCRPPSTGADHGWRPPPRRDHQPSRPDRPNSPGPHPPAGSRLHRPSDPLPTCCHLSNIPKIIGERQAGSENIPVCSRCYVDGEDLDRAQPRGEPSERGHERLQVVRETGVRGSEQPPLHPRLPIPATQPVQLRAGEVDGARIRVAASGLSSSPQALTGLSVTATTRPRAVVMRANSASATAVSRNSSVATVTAASATASGSGRWRASARTRRPGTRRAAIASIPADRSTPRTLAPLAAR